jgi:hypothetical protein
MHVKHACKNMLVKTARLHACFYKHVNMQVLHACFYKHVNMHVLHACFEICMSDFTGEFLGTMFYKIRIHIHK